MSMEPLYPLIRDLGYSVNNRVLKEAMAETTITDSVPHGAFTIHYGHRHGLPIAMIENHADGDSALNVIWHDHERMVQA